MAMLYINARCRQILNVLLSHADYVSVNAIAKALQVSRRTVYYDIDKINLWLEQAGLSHLEIVREKGLYLSQQEREKIQTMLESDSEDQVYIFSPEERIKIIICYVIYAQKAIYMEQFTDCFAVSRNTIFADLKEVTKKLKKYDLKLDYQPKQGYIILGDPVRVRALFILYFNEMETLFKSGVIRFFNQKQIQDYYHTLKKIEQTLEISYVDGVLYSIAALVPLLYQHRTAIRFTDLKQTEIVKTQDMRLCRNTSRIWNRKSKFIYRYICWDPELI